MAEVKVDLDAFVEAVAKAVGAQPPVEGEAPAPVEATTTETETPAAAQATETTTAEAPTETAAPAEAPVEAVAKATEDISAKVSEQGETIDRVVALFDPGDADNEPGAIVKAIQQAQEDNTAIREALTKALDRIEQLESRTIRKSLDGQEARTEVTKSAEASTDDFMRSLVRNAKRI